MNKYIILLIYFVIYSLGNFVVAQEKIIMIDSIKIVERNRPESTVYNRNNAKTFLCYLSKWKERYKIDSAACYDSLLNKSNWKIQIGNKGERSNINIEDIQIIIMDSSMWAARLKVFYFSEPQVNISFRQRNIEKVTYEETIKSIEFGKGKSIDLAISRLADQKATFAFDYKVDVSIIELNLKPKSNFLKSAFNGIDFYLKSKGTIGSDSSVRNGTQSSVGLRINPYYKIFGYAYFNKIGASYQIETKNNSATNNAFEVLNRSWKIDCQLQVPLSEYPIYEIKKITNYTRMASPIILTAEFQPKGTSGSGDSTLRRLVFNASWELAISPYLICQLEYERAKLFSTPSGEDDSRMFWAFTIAQDLDVLKQSIGFLKMILGSDEETKGKNFIFLKISDGSRAPAFQKKREIKFGFATYL